jgi:ABC-type amino acid transport substrate-binding protein
MALTLAVVAQAVWWPRPWWTADDPKTYFGDTLTIGVNGHLNGFSLGNERGLDVSLAHYIAHHYGYDDDALEIVPVDQDKRAQDLTSGRLDMVISNYTMTRDRADEMDFAGPYYLDTTGLWRNLDKDFGAEATSCVVGNTTGQEQEASHDSSGRIIPTTVEPVLDACIGRFLNPHDPLQYIATDWSIIRLAAPGARLGEEGGYTPADWVGKPDVAYKPGVEIRDPGPPPPDRRHELQPYGVAIRNQLPTVCQDLTHVLDQFLHDMDENGPAGFHQAYATDLRDKLGAAVEDWHYPHEAEQPGPGKLACS